MKNSLILALQHLADMAAQPNRHDLRFSPSPDARPERARLLREEEEGHGLEGSRNVQAYYSGAQ